MAVARENEIIHEVIDKYVQYLKDNAIPLCRVYLFGSFAKGNTRRWSDIDIAVFLDQEEVDKFDDGTRLMRLSCDIDTRIEPHAFARTDLNDPDPFVMEIIKTGERIL